MGDDDTRLAELFHLAPCGYLVTDGDGMVTEVNAELERIIGLGADELCGRRPLASLLSVGGRIYLETHLLPMLQHDQGLREIALDLLHADGRRVPVLLNADATGAGPGAMRAVVLETRERHRYEQDLLEATRLAEQAREASAALAKTLQQTLIPPAPPEVPFLTIAAAYRPAGDGTVVGGDFYDVFQVGPAEWVVALGDVSGKGISAATVTSFVRYTIRALAIEHRDPRRILEMLDTAMHLNRTEHYCTVVLAMLAHDDGGWSIDLGLAGHPAALVRRRDGSVDLLGHYGSPVGLVDAASFETVRFALRDETVLLFTDGVTEARGADGLLGDERLLELLSAAGPDPAQITDLVVGAALDYQGGTASDDIAVVAFTADDHRTTPPCERGQSDHPTTRGSDG